MPPRYNPVPYDHLVIPRGANFEASWYADNAETGTPAEWDGWTARMQIRTSFDGDILATLTSDGDGDGLVALGDQGNVTATLPAEFTATMATGSAVFDLNFTDPDGAIWRSVEGSIAITPEVTSA